jgi:hypothetical protein
MIPTREVLPSGLGRPAARFYRDLFYGLVAEVFSWLPLTWAQSFESAVASCTQQVKFCEKAEL